MYFVSLHVRELLGARLALVHCVAGGRTRSELAVPIVYLLLELKFIQLCV